jgi:GAF domain-containing protein
MLAQVLEEKGTGARVLPPIAITEGALAQLDLTGIEVVCLSYLHPQPQVFARYICRRLRRRAPHLKLMVCCWNAPPQGTHTEDMARQMSADAAILSLEVCISQIDAWLAHQKTASDAQGGQNPAAIDNEHERLAALSQLGLAGSRRHSFDESTKMVAEAFGTPIALVSLITDEQPVLPGAQALPPDLAAARQTPREESVCGHVVLEDEVVVSEDVTKDPRFANNPLVLEKGIRFYAGAPLRTSSGLVWAPCASSIWSRVSSRMQTAAGSNAWPTT